MLPDRFWNKVVMDGQCWLWSGAIGGTFPDGLYGYYWHDGKVRRAHVVSYEDVNGRVPEGLELDHLCRRHLCIRPDHLEPVTHAENLARGEGIGAQHARQASCINGHPFTEANTYITPSGHRQCRRCKADRQARYDRQKRKARTG